LIWWLLIMTPGVLSMTCFIWRMKAEGIEVGILKKKNPEIKQDNTLSEWHRAS